MKLITHFDAFLRDTVNLNKTRIDTLESNVSAIKTFIRGSDWKPTIRYFYAQGSWAHQTIIKPVDLGEFDADLLVMVDPVDGWSASDYVSELGNAFKASGLYGEKVKVWEYCVTITYAGEQKVDIAPCIVGRVIDNQLEVCNRPADVFERSEPVAYTKWLVERNSISGGNSFRKATRLIKYLKGIKKRFSCSSVLLTTLLGYVIYDSDDGGEEFSDVPTALQTLIGRLDELLQQNPSKPVVSNPYLPSEDFADYLTTKKYKNLRKSIHRYRRWIDEAVALEGREESIKAWRRLFGSEFAPDVVVKSATSLVEATWTTYRGVLLSSGAHLASLVDKVLVNGVNTLPVLFNRPPYLQEPSWEEADDQPIPVVISASQHRNRQSEGRRVNSGEALSPNGSIRFEAFTVTGRPFDSANYTVHWRVTNTGQYAVNNHLGRGEFYLPTSGNIRWEPLSFRGVHFVEAFLVRRSDELLVGQSEPFYVVIT